MTVGACAVGGSWCNTTESGEGCLVAYPFGVITSGNKKLTNEIGADEFNEVLDLTAELFDFVVEDRRSSCNLADGCLDCGEQQPVWGVGEPNELIGFWSEM